MPALPASRARLLVLAAAVLFSTGGAAIKATSLSGWQVASFRSGVAALAVLLLLPGARRVPSAKVLLAGAVYALTMVLFVLANKLTTSANAIYLQSASPLYLLLLGPWLLDEPVRRRDLAYMAALAAGLALFFLGSEAPQETAPDPVLGNLVATASGVFWAFTVVGLRWIGRRHGSEESLARGDEGAQAVLAGNLFAFLGCLPLALPVGGPPRAADAGLVLYLGIFQIGLAYVCLTRGMRRVPALEAALLLLVEPVLNPVWTWAAHGERVSGYAMAGGAVILGTTLAKTFADTRSGGG
jgi:drug/metabolite transporter (DMT)-like permease